MNKKVCLIVVIVLLVLISGIVYFVVQNDNGMANDKILKEAALDYFDRYVSVYSGSSAYTITLKDLKEKNYNLNEFAGCNENKTYVIVTISNTTGKVIKTEIIKKC